MRRALAFIKHWLIPDVGGWIPYFVCLVALWVLLYFISAPEPWRFLLGLMGWITAMAWYAHWRRRA
jgi:hypothetical protein